MVASQQSPAALASSDRTDPNMVAKWYRFGMTRQIAVRLPDDIVDFVDRLVADGYAESRADVVTRALTRERRRELAARDAELLASAAPSADLDRLAAWAGGHHPDLD